MHFITEGLPPGVEEQWKLSSDRLDEWLQNEVFSFKWWVLLVLFILMAVLWWKLADKTRLSELFLYTAFIVIYIIVLDELGEELSLWYYTVDLIPWFPPITAVDISCMPLVYMLIYQRFKTWKSFIIATVIMSVVFCFIFEPIFDWVGIYKMLTWKSYYGLPLYFLIAVASKAAVSLVNSISEKKKMTG